MADWTLETEDPKELKYSISAHVALEDSDTETWGVAKDTDGSFQWKTGDGELVGTWSRSPSDGLIHVFLETPLLALVNKATQHFAELARQRETAVDAPKSKGARAPRAPKVVEKSEAELEAEERMNKIASLRSKIKR